MTEPEATLQSRGFMVNDRLTSFVGYRERGCGL